MSRVRWWILALIFFATTINYLDRIVFSVLIPVIRKDLGLNDQEYGLVNGAFQAAYTVGFLFMGKLVDRYGTRIGYAVAIAWWSMAAMLHATAKTTLMLAGWRALLGMGESGNFPAAIKGVAEWFPKRDRAFATGIFNAGTNVASMVGPPLFAWMLYDMGLDWRMCFLVTGGTGFLWLVVWLVMHREPKDHPGVNAAELAYIHSDPEEATQRNITWTEALRYRETWGFALGKFLTDPVWWFYLYWLPPYLYDVRKFDLKQMDGRCRWCIWWRISAVWRAAGWPAIGSGRGGTRPERARGRCWCLRR